MSKNAISPLRPEFDIDRIRAEFPVLARTVNDKPLVYLDTAASAQRPRAVIDATSHFYTEINANVHRGVHTLSQEATEAMELSRVKLARFINAPSSSEVVFTRGTTESINLVAQSYLRPLLKPGDEILITEMEHHSNIVPWQMLCEQTGAMLKVVAINDRGELRLDELEAMLTGRVKLLAVVHISNALGSINPIRTICGMAKKAGVPVLVDGAQAVPHQSVDVQALGCEFYCLSGHKMYGPTGIGALWAPAATLEAMPPWQGGGEMILEVSFEKTVYNDAPGKFEAGTPNIAGSIGLGAAVDWLQSVGLQHIAAHENDLLGYATGRLGEIEGLRLIGTARNKAGVLSFVIDGTHPTDVGTIVDHYGVAIRTGHHCAMPANRRFGLTGSARASLGVYNHRGDIDTLVDALQHARQMLI